MTNVLFILSSVFWILAFAGDLASLTLPVRVLTDSAYVVGAVLLAGAGVCRVIEDAVESVEARIRRSGDALERGQARLVDALTPSADD